MEKNGFTLIELIVTIGLMVLMGILIASNLSSVFSHQEDENFNEFKGRLEDAACIYIDLSDPEIKAKKSSCKQSACYVNTYTLILNGLLDEDEKNPNTNTTITGSERIKIEYIDGEKTCTYEE